MKIGTISVNIHTPDYNYGAVLHSWAFQQYLKRLNDVECAEVIDYTTPYLEGYYPKFGFRTSLRSGNIAETGRLLLKPIRHIIRDIRFRKFVREHMDISEARYTQKKLNDAELKYDVIVCESDVIWSPQLTEGKFDQAFFAALDSMKNKKKIAYSPSMGDIVFTEEQFEEFGRLVQNLDEISCRESYQKEVIERYVHKPVVHVLDPVMLLDAEDYKEITGERVCQTPYLLLYLPVNDNAELRRHADEYARKKGLEIVEISTKLEKNPNRSIRTLTTAGVEEFLSCIKYAECIFTNSFHAVCFGALFHRDMYMFSRKYGGKVKDMCKVLGIENRYFADDMFVEREPIPYDEVNSRIACMKEKSKRWFESALHT